MKIVTTGIQWCGKGTQARLLVENHGFTLVEMGAEFRKVVASGTELGNTIWDIINSWALVPDELGIQVMETVLEKYKDTEKAIFDAFIRLPWNKTTFDNIIDDYKVVFFELSVEKAKNRLLWRMYDKETGETFQAGTTVNPKNGNILVKRDDDKDEAAILKRIQEFEEQTLPIVEIQRNEWKIIDINADQSIDHVYQELVSKLGLK